MAPSLHMAFDLSNKPSRLALSDGAERRKLAVPVANLAGLADAVAKAKARFGMPITAGVLSSHLVATRALIT